jgi:hypothetical protein
MTSDLFDHTILCSACHRKMEKGLAKRNGFKVRMLFCPGCGEKVFHPEDIAASKEFDALKKKDFRVKLRFVGNSYAVSIPRELVDFLHSVDSDFNEMVGLCLEDEGRISLRFQDG